MSRYIHLCLDVRGAISGTGWKFISSPDGRKAKKAEAVEWLMDRLAEGKRVLPIGECDGFSFQTGCPGHEETEATDATAAAPAPIGDLASPLHSASGGDLRPRGGDPSPVVREELEPKGIQETLTPGAGGQAADVSIAMAERGGGDGLAADAPDEPCEAKGADRPAGGLSASPAKSALSESLAAGPGTGPRATLAALEVTHALASDPPRERPTMPRPGGMLPEPATTTSGEAPSQEASHALVQRAGHSEGQPVTPRAAAPAHREAAAPKRLDIRIVGADGTETPVEVLP